MISIIVPVYNVENFVARCLDSIIHQTFEDFEVQLVDDGSTDQSGTICDEYARKDHRIKVIHTPNRGVSSARNKGLENASGEYICFIDSDDFVHPLFLELLYQAITFSSADIAICGREKKNNDIINDLDCYDPKLEIKKIDYLDYVNDINCNNVWTKIYRHGILINHYFDPDLSYSEDAVFNFSLICSVKDLKLVKIDLPLYYYYIRENSIIHTLPKAIAFQEFEWYIKHWNIFLKEYEHIIFEHSVHKMARMRFHEYLTPGYANITSKWSYLSGQLIKKMWSIDNLTFTKKIRFFIILKCFWLYRLLLIINDRTILDYEKKKREKYKNN